MRPRPLTHVEQLAADFRLGLLEREGRTVGAISDAYRKVLAQIERDMESLFREMEEARLRGEPVTSSSVFRERRLERLRTDAMRELARVGGEAVDLVEAARLEQIAASLTEAAQLVDAAFAGAGTAHVATSITAGVPTGSVIQIAAAIQEGGPLNNMLERVAATGRRRALRGSTDAALRARLTAIAGDAATKAADKLLVGVALGQNPRKIAAAMRKDLAVPQYHAERIARTEVMRAHHASTLERYQTYAALPTPLVEGWTWYAQTGGCCVACLAMHGTKHPLDETLNGHPNCRCIMLPIRASAADLGYDDTPDIPTGDDLLASMIEDGDLDRFGPGVRDALESGRADLGDFVQVRTDPQWGSMRSQRSLTAVLETTT